MSLIAWNETMRLGIETMDADHHRMIDIINAVFDALQSGGDKADIDRKLDKLAWETIGHFDREERMMQLAGYPKNDWLAHQETHNVLKQNILDMQEHFLADRDATVTQENFQLLKRWLSEHIQGPDKLYADYIRHQP